MSIQFGKPAVKYPVILVVFLISLAACTTQEVEVTRLVEQEVEVEVTRVVEQEVEVEVTRVVTEEVEVPVEVEVTRIVETVPEEEEAPEGPPPFEPPTAVIASGLRSPRQLFYDDEGTLYIAEAGTAGDSTIEATAGSIAKAGLTGQISAVSPDGSQSVVLPALPSIDQGNDDAGYRGTQAIYVTDDSYWVGVGEAPVGLFGLSLFYNVYEIDRETWRVKNIIDTASAAVEAGQPTPNDTNSDPVDIDVADDGTVYIADAGCNCLWAWTEEGGLVPFHLWDSDDNPVPTGVTFGPEGDIYISFLSGFPFPVEGTRIERWSADGELVQTYGGLTMATDVLVTDDGTIYAVEFAAGLGELGFVPDSGRVVIVSEEGVTPVMDGLRMPYGLAQDPEGNLVVSVVSAFDPNWNGMVIEVEGP